MQKAPTTTRATPIPPARIGVPRENKPQPEQKMSQRGGKPARIKSRKNCPSVQISKNPGEKPRHRREKHRPRRSKTCRNWPVKDNRHPPTSVRPARNGYPQDRPPQISNRKSKTNYNQASHSSLDASSRHKQPRMAVSAKECPSLGVILSVEQLCLPETSVSGSWPSGSDSWDAEVLEERSRRVVMKDTWASRSRLAPSSDCVAKMF